MSYFLGIDGGGTKTTCLLGDESSVRTSVTVGGSNLIRSGEQATKAALHKAIEEVCRTGKIAPGEIAAACAGMAGAGRVEVGGRITEMLREHLGGRIKVVGDMVIAHEAALQGRAGIVVIAGTGSIAYGRNQAGASARAGGWGYMISDEGAGHWIGVQAVAAILRSADVGLHTNLRECVFERWKVQDCDQLVRFANASPPADFAGLFPDVVAVAEAGDDRAREILQRAGVELAALAGIVFHRLWRQEDSLPIAMAGGVFRNSAMVRESFVSQLKQRSLRAETELSQAAPVEGALSLARKLASGQV